MRYTTTYTSDFQALMSVLGIEALKGKSLLISGPTGLIGSCLCDALLYLNRKHHFGMTLHLAARSEEKVKERFEGSDGEYGYVHFDATVPTILEGDFDYIVHAASNAHPVAYATQPVETMLANVIGTQSMLEYARTHQGCRLLYVSSSEVYGKRTNNTPSKEGDYGYVDILDPRSCYPTSKRAAETMCASYADEYGVDFIVVRPGHIYGPTMTSTDTRAHAEFARLAVRGEKIVLKSAGEQLRSYCYVVDCVTAMITVLLHGGSGEAYNISNPDSVVTVAELAGAFAAASGSELAFDVPTDVERRGYTKSSCSAVDSEKLYALGWCGQFSLDRGVRHTLMALRTTP